MMGFSFGRFFDISVLTVYLLGSSGWSFVKGVLYIHGINLLIFFIMSQFFY